MEASDDQATKQDEQGELTNKLYSQI